MGFPVGYTEVFMPKPFVHLLSVLGFLRSLIICIFSHVGLSDLLLEPDSSPVAALEPARLRPSLSASLIRELLPAARLGEEEARDDGRASPESCAVCLYEFEGGEEVRWLRNCPHVFHRTCIDRWLDHDRDTCPLCRNPFVPDDLREEFNRRVWCADGGSAFEDALLETEFGSIPVL